MARSLFSEDWYRVAHLRPRLRIHMQVHRQRFRGERWYVLEDRQGGSFHRLPPSGYLMLTLMNGRRTMQEIWEILGERLGTEQPPQEDCILLLTQLWHADLLSAGVTPDLEELDRRGDRQRRRLMLARVRNPLALRVPLIDPDRFLDRTLWLVRPLLGPAGLVAWCLLVGIGVALAVMNWPALTSNLADRVLAAQNVALIVAIYPVVKTLHELGHGYFAKRWGGAVHEVGIMLLVLMPVPYVDASSALAFPEKWRRAFVGAAGIMVELALAAVAMLVWLEVEDGWVRAIAFNTMLISGASTLFFNGNPLLRFDGYYVLCDLIESPNLGTRANAYVLYLLQRRLFGMVEAEPPPHVRAERKWLVGYAAASTIYRIGIVFGIALFIATKLFFVGAALAIWCLASLMLLPLAKSLHFLVASPRLRGRRRRAVATTGASTAVLAGVLFALPVPYATMAQGVVLDPPGAQLRAGTAGQVAELLAAPGARVAPGDPVLRLKNPELAGRLAVLAAERREFAFRLRRTRALDPVSTELLELQLADLGARIAALHERIDALTLIAGAGGRLVLPAGDSLVGRYLREGEQVGVLQPTADPVIRVALGQDAVDLVRSRTEGITVAFVDAPRVRRPAEVSGFVPDSLDRLPSAVLAQRAGGDILVDPADPEGLRPLREVFQLDLRLQQPDVTAPIGQRVYVRFDHGAEPLAARLWRSVRQLFLGVFDV